MARKRMFDIEVINQDSFYDLPMDAKALYFLLGMEADDEGFVAPKKVLRLYGGTEDSIKILITKGYLIPFQSGVVVITDWKRNNYLDKNKITETIYQDEKEMLSYDEDKKKYFTAFENTGLNESLTKVNKKLTQNRIEENRIEENRIDILSDEIIEYLNNKINAKYKSNSKTTRKHINARLSEGFTVDDFKKVIDKKYDEWHGTDMQQYLRPETLFGTKFDSYLNAPIKKIRRDNRTNYTQRDISKEDFSKYYDNLGG